jgi:hypothetical protein
MMFCFPEPQLCPKHQAQKNHPPDLNISRVRVLSQHHDTIQGCSGYVYAVGDEDNGGGMARYV